MGSGKRADQVIPGALDWLGGRTDDWFLHVLGTLILYRTPEDYGNPFESDPVPSWHTEDVRMANWDLAGPHSAQEPWGFRPMNGRATTSATMECVLNGCSETNFDGYDVGIRYADDAVGVLLNKLADLNVLEDTAVLISSDHGEAFGELGVYADHQD